MRFAGRTLISAISIASFCEAVPCRDELVSMLQDKTPSSGAPEFCCQRFGFAADYRQSGGANQSGIAAQQGASNNSGAPRRQHIARHVAALHATRVLHGGGGAIDEGIP